ncbi:MAG: hypothetical protein WCC11_03675 [Gammaproteobacteria bacterium]
MAETSVNALNYQHFEAAQVAADKCAAAWGSSAPHWVDDESLRDYRLRLLKPYKNFSKDWRQANLSDTHDPTVLDNAEKDIYRCATAAATSNETFPNMLRAVNIKDATGRLITKFYGDPEHCWGPFKLPVRRVMGFRTGEVPVTFQRHN